MNTETEERFHFVRDVYFESRLKKIQKSDFTLNRVSSMIARLPIKHEEEGGDWHSRKVRINFQSVILERTSEHLSVFVFVSDCLSQSRTNVQHYLS